MKSLEVFEQGNETEIKDFSIGFAKKNGIPHKVFKVAADKKKRIDSSFIKVVFGKIDKPTYDLLMKNYLGDGNVPFDPKRNYELIDFLPAKMQAFVNRWMPIVKEVEPRIPGEYGASIDRTLPVNVITGGFNCWVTVYEIMRDLTIPLDQKKAKIYFFPIFDYEREVLFNKSIHESSVVLSPEARKPSEANFKLRNEGRKFGDIMGINVSTGSSQTLAHTAIWIDDDLYFEKTNIGFDTPIRLVKWDDLVEIYNDLLEQQTPDFDKNNTTPGIQFIRLKLDKKVTLSDPERFSIGALNGALFPSKEDERTFIKDMMDSGASFDHAVREAKSFRKIPDDLVNKIIAEEEISSPNGNALHKIKTFNLKVDAETKRMKLDGFEKLTESFENSNILCVNATSEIDKFNYLITTDFSLSIKDKKTGKLVAAVIEGKAPKTTATLEKPQNPKSRVLAAEYNTGSKIISVFDTKENGFSEVVLSHPGVQDSVFLKCNQDGLVFNQIPK